VGGAGIGTVGVPGFAHKIGPVLIFGCHLLSIIHLVIKFGDWSWLIVVVGCIVDCPLGFLLHFNLSRRENFQSEGIHNVCWG